jgi:cysteine-rich repeat protein
MNLPLHRLPFALSFGALLLTGCPSDDVPADTTTTETGDGDGDTGDGDGDTGDGDGDGDTGDGDGDTGATCGDGVVDTGETCDDGNTADGDGCSSTCMVSECGLVWTATAEVPNSTAGAFDVAVDADGSIYAAGITINADNDAWVVKWNADGSVAWTQSFDSGNGNDAAAAIALGPNGEVYVAGWMQGTADDDLWYAGLDGATGDETWSQLVQGPMMIEDGDDLATGIAVDPTGGVVVVGRSRVGEGDDDVWIRKAMADSGDEVWTSTWTGVGDGAFSTDRSGSVAVAADGTIWVAAREHVDFDSQTATLLEFDGDGNPLSTLQPQPGGNQSQDPVDVAVDGDTVFFAMEKTNFPYRGWLYKYEAGAEAWVKTEQDWLVIGEDWAVRGLGIDADGNLGIGGVFTNEETGEGISWGEAWVAKLDGAGEIICRSSHMVGEDGAIIPPSLDIDAAGYSSAGFGLTGIETAGQGNATQLWTGFFMP